MTNSNPSNFKFTLGSAQRILGSLTAGWRADQVAEARKVVAYWKARAKARAKKALAA